MITILRLPLAALLATFFAQAAAADECGGTAAPDKIIAACTARLAGGSLDDTERAIAYFERALAYERSDDTGNALTDLDAAVHLRFDYQDARFARAGILLKQHRPARALYDLAKLTPETQHRRIGVLAFTAIAHDEMAHHDRALAAYGAALALGPGEMPIRILRGLSHDLNGEHEAALADMGVVIEAKPDDPHNLVVRAGIYRHLGRLDDAVRDGDRAVQLAPNDAATLNARCWNRAAMKRDLSGALADCNASIRLWPRRAIAYDTRGFLHLQQGDTAAAIADYDHALVLDPRHYYSLFGRGVAKRRQGDVRGGDNDIAAAEAIMPTIRRVFAADGVTP